MGEDEGYAKYIAGYMGAVNIERRMVTAFGHQLYGYGWWDRPAGRSTRQLRMGANMFVFALTHEGSITNLLMDEVR